MTRDELLAEANSYAGELGLKPVSKRQLFDWRDEHLIPPPTPRGGGRARGVQRDWSDDALEAVKLILRLRSMGERRASQYRAYLWICGAPIPADQAREAIISEFRRMLIGLRRDLRNPDAHSTDFSRRALIERLGPIDVDLARVVPIPDGPSGPPALSAIAEMVSGDEGLAGVQAALSIHIPEMPDLASIPEVSTLLAGFSGFAGLADETDKSAIEILENASFQDFEQARETVVPTYFAISVAAGLFGGDDPEFLKKILTLDRTEWAISFLVQALNGAAKNAELTTKIGAKNPN